MLVVTGSARTPDPLAGPLTTSQWSDPMVLARLWRDRPDMFERDDLADCVPMLIAALLEADRQKQAALAEVDWLERVSLNSYRTVREYVVVARLRAALSPTLPSHPEADPS